MNSTYNWAQQCLSAYPLQLGWQKTYLAHLQRDAQVLADGLLGLSLKPILLCGPYGGVWDAWPKWLCEQKNFEVFSCSLLADKDLALLHQTIQNCLESQKTRGGINLLYITDCDRCDAITQKILVQVITNLYASNLLTKDVPTQSPPLLVLKARARYRVTEELLNLCLVCEHYLPWNLDKLNALSKQGVLNSTESKTVLAPALCGDGVELIPLQVAVYEGRPACFVTSNLSGPLAEQGQIAYSLLRKYNSFWGYSTELLASLTVHIHLGSARIAKQGTSAGLALFFAIIIELDRYVQAQGMGENSGPPRPPALLESLVNYIKQIRSHNNTICASGELDLTGQVGGVDGWIEKKMTCELMNVPLWGSSL